MFVLNVLHSLSHLNVKKYTCCLVFYKLHQTILILGSIISTYKRIIIFTTDVFFIAISKDILALWKNAPNNTIKTEKT